MSLNEILVTEVKGVGKAMVEKLAQLKIVTVKDLLEYLNKNKEITVAQFRDITKSNRKISIVMLEHFDRNRITKRVEDKRILY